MENRVIYENKLHSPAVKQKDPVAHKKSGVMGWLKDYGTRLGNNIAPLNLYGRLKDYYKGIEIAAPWIADWLTKKPLENRTKNLERSDLDNQETLKDAVHDLYKKSQKPKHNLATGVAGDTAFFGVQRLLSWFSAWAEQSKVKRVYGKLAQIEFGKSESDITFKDLKKSKNPMLRDAADYYGKKSFIRSFTDFFGLARLIPLAIYGAQGKWGKYDSKKLINNTDKGFGKFLDGLANFGDGIKMLMFAKTFFFQWYFSSRQTGSFYESKEIWNITEGISSSPNRALNENRLPDEFVTRQQIAALYESFREENPDMKMEQFTPDDPLSSRVFEQTARYLNHTYMPKLFAISEPAKQHDLPQKTLTHAMLTELVGTGGLRIEDAVGSAIRLEVMAYHGQFGVEAGINKYREVSKIINKLDRPERSKYQSQDDLVEATHNYLAQIDSIGREYLADYWPPKYINEEIKQGYISSVFEGTELEKEKVDYIASALFMREQEKTDTYSQKENVSELDNNEKEQKLFTDKVTRKDNEALLNRDANNETVGIMPNH